MKALSLTQPWATLVAIGAKRIETRSWSTNYRGELAIHAAKGWPREYRDLPHTEPFRSTFMGAGLRGPYSDFQGEMPRGAIVAVACLMGVGGTELVTELKDFFAPGVGLLPHEIEFGNYAPGRFAWLLHDVRRLATPVACRGTLGLWTVPGDVERQVRDQLARVA